MPEYKLTLRKMLKHLNVVNKHRFKVFCFCCKVGIPFQGLVHDLSKYSPTEFIESAKYYTDGKYSPISNCKKDKGYSIAWIHHKNHNKHHYEYWYDYAAPTKAPIIPFKYFLEMACDSFAAGITYAGKDWTKETQLIFWKRAREKAQLHPAMMNLFDRLYKDVSIKGLKPVLKRKYLKKIYYEYTDNKSENINE